jgi:hypothetical protein
VEGTYRGPSYLVSTRSLVGNRRQEQAGTGKERGSKHESSELFFSSPAFLLAGAERAWVPKWGDRTSDPDESASTDHDPAQRPPKLGNGRCIPGVGRGAILFFFSLCFCDDLHRWLYNHLRC